MLYPDIPELSKQQLSELCEEFRRHNFINPEISEKLGVKRGLRNADGTGVLAGLTNICDVVGYHKDENGSIIPEDGKLIYRGIDLNDHRCPFPEYHEQDGKISSGNVFL